jgi:hypothetical protein
LDGKVAEEVANYNRAFSGQQHAEVIEYAYFDHGVAVP